MGIKHKRLGPEPNPTTPKPEWQRAVDKRGTWAGLRILVAEGKLPGPASSMIDDYLRSKRR